SVPAAGAESAPVAGAETLPAAGAETLPAAGADPANTVPERILAAFGFRQEDIAFCKAMAESGADPIGSLGYDGPLAALSPAGRLLADYCRESVAVVTNPALDREREREHFSTQWEFGPRSGPSRVTIDLPVFADRDLAGLAARLATKTLAATFPASGDLRGALARLGGEAVAAVAAGAELLVCDDGGAFAGAFLPIDPLLALATVDRALAAAGRRRDAAVIVRSGSLRHLHDLALVFGLGADGVAPWIMIDLAGSAAPRLLEAIGKGLEKIVSTMGTHELRGYGRNFATIGVGPEIAALLGVRDFGGSERAGLTIEGAEQAARARARLAAPGDEPVKARRERRFYPYVWKAAGQVAAGQAPYAAYSARVEEEARRHPVALRHLLALAPAGRTPVRASEVDTRVGTHEFPIAISAMSFGSQGETAFRAYLEAARRLNVVCINGEGGEIGDLVGRYRRHRGQQVASGRFGVTSEMLNSACIIEIKIGQGAKPGEGGHLPGRKVTAQVARARNATPGVDLISPSNNHDIYSIEDLAQLVLELREVNPFALISVKVPVVPNIGTIAVGIAKAGADAIALAGCEGGTGAARVHALEHVGLPIEIGVSEAHRALTAAGLRHLVELWADGGLKTGREVVKLMLLGANRCGFGTLAMVAAGCTICRGCQCDTCHVGIATQIADAAEAAARGLKRFEARDFGLAVQQLCTFLGALGDELRELTGMLGFRRTQDLVGHGNCLRQVAGHDQVDLGDLLQPLPVLPGLLETARDPVRRARERRTRGRRVFGRLAPPPAGTAPLVP
ncbi:MAG: glutamate synthase, partial [Candidatus Sericytochromatia bacterium]|nr:glutamate synthase [Candidatus Tanganyikabacteria bacterium]